MSVKILSTAANSTNNLSNKSATNWSDRVRPTDRPMCNKLFASNHYAQTVIGVVNKLHHHEFCWQHNWFVMAKEFWRKFQGDVPLLLWVSKFPYTVPSVLWGCWLGDRKSIRTVKNWVVGCWHGYLSGVRCRLAYGSDDATATHCILLQ